MMPPITSDPDGPPMCLFHVSGLNIEVMGPEGDAVLALHDLFGELGEVDIANHPWRDPKYHMRCRVVAAEEGSDALRFLTCTVLGRPRITVEFTITEGDRIVVSEQLTAHAYYTDRRAASLIEVNPGIKESAYEKTNSRRIVEQVVKRVAAHCRLEKEASKRLLKKVAVSSPDILGMKIAAMCVGLLAATCTVAAFFVPPDMRLGFVVGGLICSGVSGLLLGWVLGHVVAMVRNWFG